MFEFLWREGRCPACGAPDARIFITGKSKCRRSSCSSFDVEHSQTKPPAKPVPKPAAHFPAPIPSVTLKYLNHEGEEKLFTADRSSLVTKGEHVLVKVAPTGKRIALARKSILNLAEVQGLLVAAQEDVDLWAHLTPVERQLVGYHRKHKSTSAKYEEVLSRYPELRGS